MTDSLSIAEGRALPKLNWKLPAHKIESTCGNSISRIYLETLWKLLMNQSQELLDIKLGPFTQEELDSVLRKIKNRKAAGLVEIPLEVWRPENLMTYCSDKARLVFQILLDFPYSLWYCCLLTLGTVTSICSVQWCRGLTLWLGKHYESMMRGQQVIWLCHICCWVGE